MRLENSAIYREKHKSLLKAQTVKARLYSSKQAHAHHWGTQLCPLRYVSIIEEGSIQKARQTPNCRRFGLGGKIECRTRKFWCESIAVCT